MASSSSEEKEVKTLLQTLREKPADNEAAAPFLQRVFSYLMKVLPTPSGQLHWFCDEASETTVAAASFLLRLFAFNGASVETWKQGFRRCVTSCVFCVESLERIKASARTTYFGAYQDAVLRGFFDKLEDWELDLVLDDLQKEGFSAGQGEPKARDRSLADASPQLVFRMLANWRIFRDSRIQSILHTYVPLRTIVGWPLNHPPPGMLILLMDDAPAVRDWARRQCLSAELTVMPSESFHASYFQAFEAIAIAIQHASSTDALHHLSFSSDPAVLWSGFSAILRLVPFEQPSSNRNQSLDLTRLVFGHLHDTGPHFIDVLKCLLLLLKRCSSGLWMNEATNNAQVVFDSVKDNPTYLSLMEDSLLSGDRHCLVAWIPELLYTLQRSSIYGEMLAKAVDFFCEELQHERFKGARPTIMNTGIQLLASVFRRGEKSKDSRHNRALQTILDIHGGVVVSVAFDRRYSDEMWKSVRASARVLVDTILSSDVRKVTNTITSVSRSLAQIRRKLKPDPIPAVSVRTPIWKAVYASIQPTDIAAVSSLISIGAKMSHLTALRKNPYKGIEAVQAQGEDTVAGSDIIDQINQAISIIQSGFKDTVSTFADFTLTSAGVELISNPTVGKSVVVLMLSPIPDFQSAAQALVNLAFEKDLRAECFEALMFNDKRVDATFDGLIEFLTTYEQYASTVPEASDIARSMVICFNDVFDVLCSSPKGKLLDSAFLRAQDTSGPTSRLIEFWKKFTRGLTMTFKRPVDWSAVMPTVELTPWMRDAMVLTREVVKQWQVVENAVVGNMRKPSKQLSEVGEKIIECFQEMLPALGKWLRLTDEELLYQALAVVRNLLRLFKQTDKTPGEAGLARLLRYIDLAKNDKTKSKSRLDMESLLMLETALADCMEDEHEIQITGHVKREEEPKKLKRKEVEIEIVEAPAAKKRAQPEQKLTPHQQQLLLLNKKGKPNKAPSKPAVDPRQSTLALRHTSLKDDEAKIQAASPLPSFRRSSVPHHSISKAPVPAKPAAPATNVAPKEQSIPSSEDDDDEEEEDDPAASLAALTKTGPPTPKIKKPQERRQIITMWEANDKEQKKQKALIKQTQNQRTIALRLRPDVSSLHKVILSWNFCQDDSQPPLGNAALGNVPGDFTDYEHYRRVFEPLLLTECWAQIQQQKQEQSPSLPCTVAKKQYVSDWVDLDLSFSEQVPRDWTLSEVDIVLLSTPDKKINILAKVNSFRKNPMGTVASIRCVSQGPAAAIDMQSTFIVRQLYSLSTINREYAALISLPYVDHHDRIMHPKVVKSASIREDEVERTMALYKINKPQATAIISAMSSEGFVLIQGPPGTGKTSTICALVSRFMSQRPQPIAVPTKDKKDSQPTPKAKILICAPSNAAIDEITQRLVGRPGGKLKIVRMGSEGSVNDVVKHISLDSLVRQKVEAQTGQRVDEDLQKQLKELTEEMDALKRAREDKLQELANLRDNFSRKTILEQEVQTLRIRRQNMVAKANEVRDRVKSENRSLEALRRQMRREVIQEADVICSTLSGAGHEALIDEVFEMVIIDEAAQAVELSSIIPLKYNPVRCVMVGDPQQLPPTVISQEASRRKYDQSLFLRLFNKCPNAVHLLSIQYRMNPDISRLPSEVFYQGRIEDGPGMEELTARPWHSDAIFGKYRFFNVNGIEETGEGNSMKNKAEAQAAKSLYSSLVNQYRNEDFARRVGIISMYRAQVNELRYQFKTTFGLSILDDVDFGTVDGFQGQEKDIIILSCVRAGPGVDRIGFLADMRRLNVAITRAKSSLFILGNAPTLERSDQVWKQVIIDARSRGCIVNVESGTFFQPNIAGMTVPAPVGPQMKARTESKKQVHQTPAVPDDLVTPRGLKDSIKRTINPEPFVQMSPQMPDLAPPRVLKESMKIAASSGGLPSMQPSARQAISSIPKDTLHKPINGQSGAEPLRKPLKRPAEGPSGSSANGDLQPAPRPPPPKKPKTGGMSMFIPRKPVMKK